MFTKIYGDITQVEADVIVNAANTELIHAGGVAKAIAEKAGEELLKESDQIGYVPLGQFALTTAGKLKAKVVCHIPTICYRMNKKASLEDIEIALRSALAKIQQLNYKKVALPLLGTGVVGLSKKAVEEKILEISNDFPDLEIILVIKK